VVVVAAVVAFVSAGVGVDGLASHLPPVWFFFVGRSLDLNIFCVRPVCSDWSGWHPEILPCVCMWC